MAWAPGPPPVPPQKKKRTGLIVAIVAGAAVIVVGIAVLVGILVFGGSGPTLTSTQFATLYKQGDTFMGSPVIARETEEDLGGANEDEDCERELSGFVTSSKEVFTSTTDDYKVVVGGRYDSPDPVKSRFDAAKQACSPSRMGVYNGANWFEASVDDLSLTVMSYGNVAMMGATMQKSDAEDMAKDMQGAISEAGKR
jgi:hypothetical protein